MTFRVTYRSLYGDDFTRDFATRKMAEEFRRVRVKAMNNSPYFARMTALNAERLATVSEIEEATR